MIEFHNDHLVPPQLCCLLYAVVPKRLHLPVRFHNRRRKELHGDRGHYPLGAFYAKGGVEPAHIDINLNPIYDRSWWRHYPYTWVPSSFVWRTLLEVCLHEFGHVAIYPLTRKMNRHEYHGEYGRVYKACESLADEWMEQRIERLLRNEKRLEQPKNITGYLGARLAKHARFCWKGLEYGRLRSAYVKEARCRKTGAQLTAGNVLQELKVDPYSYSNAYRVLRRASEGIGIDYVDAAGRRHKLYTWGDVPVVAERLAARRDEFLRRSEPYGALGSPPSDVVVEGDCDIPMEDIREEIPF